MKNSALFLFSLICLIIISGCEDSSKVDALRDSLREEQSKSARLWNERSNLRNELSNIKEKLEESNNKIKSFQKDQEFTKNMIALLANGQSSDAIKIAKNIDQGWFDEIDKQMITQNKLLADMKRQANIREEREKIELKVKEKELHLFFVNVVIIFLKVLIVGVQLSCLSLIGLLIYKGNGIADQLIRSAGVIAFFIIYFLSSFQGISISSLMLSSAVLSTPIFQLGAQWAIPFIAGVFFSFLIQKQLLETSHLGERWLIVITTLLFCMLLDVFLKVDTTISNQHLPIANATFVVGLFLTLFFKFEPSEMKINKIFSSDNRT